MNLLISDLMDFKQMEAGYKLPEITRLDVSGIADRITDMFMINTSGSGIKMKKYYFAGIMWNSDEKFLTTILVNLISNAIKYSNGESVIVEMCVEQENLIIKVINKGQGIPENEIAGIFDRFSVLDNKKKNGWKQNGLGLTVTASMIKLLSGNIEVTSIPDEVTSFVVTLPYLEPDGTKLKNEYDPDDTILYEYSLPQTKYEYKEGRLTVTVIDDDPEMLWLICNIVSDEFNVLPINNSSKAIETLSCNHTDIILCDIIMKDMDSIQLSKALKSDKSTSHIPLIIVSAVHSIEVQTEALNAGAELYVTKPFDAKYLKTTIRRLLGRKEDLKDYFSSPLSMYELNMGKLQHTEDRKFLKKVYGIISKNIQNQDLSPEFIASELGMSVRTLYRKMKDVTDKGLLEIIRNGKLTVAEDLLLKSKFTIDEIVFKSGFSNRASFYRSFAKKYGCTPTEFIEKNNI
ncbi:MAG: ATP-binding protein [Tannerellaceae bacterium]|nr:ATP-binding protein [Tannerellaceae bacterium]